jgi:hypothetical protein
MHAMDNGRNADRWQEHEIWYVVDRVHDSYPEAERATIVHLVDILKKEVLRRKGPDALVARVKQEFG